MKRNLKNFGTALLILAFVAVSGASFAQKLKLKNGDLSVLKGQKEVLVKFTYEGLKIGKMPVEEYVNKKVTEKNKKKPGSGDQWLKKWQRDLDSVFPRHFVNHFNAMGKLKHVKMHRTGDAKYMFVVNTTFIEPGYNVGISSKRASANMVVTLVAVSDPGKPLATITISKSPGNSMFGANYSSADRIAGCFETAGEYLASFLIRKKAF